LHDPPKFTQIGIFGLKTNHLATLGSLVEIRPCKQKKNSRKEDFAAGQQKSDPRLIIKNSCLS
jgi:hypothetical protein